MMMFVFLLKRNFCSACWLLTRGCFKYVNAVDAKSLNVT